MRRSEWKVRVGDPKSPFGWWWNDYAPELYGILGFGGFFATFAAALWGYGWPWFALGFANLAFFLSRRHPNDPFDFVKSLDEPAPPGRRCAAVEYRRDGLITGRDWAAYWIVEGWLFAECARSDFALRPCDVVRVSAPKGRVHLQLTDDEEIVLFHSELKEGEDLGRWHRGASPEGEPKLPPSTVHPKRFASSIGRMIVAHALFGALFLALVLLPRGPFKAIAGLSLVLGGVFILRRLWARHSKLKRIDRRADDSPAGQAPPLQVAAERTIGESRAEVRNSYAE
ncbi:hypothetical protein EON82_01025 [bacterium]|nr:MAG: hypothetical protein EON82_01025 [bacterium]